MISKLKVIAIRDAITLIIAAVVTITSFVFLAIWRHFDSKTFSFLQIIFVTFIAGIAIYSLTIFLNGSLSRLLVHRQLAIIAITFTVLSFFVLNIDRSRSFYLIKWVGSYETAGISSSQLANEKHLIGRDLIDILQRIDEQKASGTIQEVNGRLKLSPLGSRMNQLFLFLAKFEQLDGYLKA